MNKTIPLAGRLTNAIANRDLTEIHSISSEISAGIISPTKEEEDVVVGKLNKIKGRVDSSDTRGWNKPAGLSKEKIVEVIERALCRLKGEDVQPQKDDPAAFRRRRKTEPLKRIPSRETRTGESNAVRLKRR